jgi:hypothetical protein
MLQYKQMFEFMKYSLYMFHYIQGLIVLLSSDISVLPAYIKIILHQLLMGEIFILLEENLIFYINLV